LAVPYSIQTFDVVAQVVTLNWKRAKRSMSHYLNKPTSSIILSCYGKKFKEIANG
jgi:hypothetical protein